jgi:hypothetical protein
MKKNTVEIDYYYLMTVIATLRASAEHVNDPVWGENIIEILDEFLDGIELLKTALENEVE